MQTVTGVKFLVVSDPKQQGIDQLLDKIYELYSDFALKVGLDKILDNFLILDLDFKNFFVLSKSGLT